MTFIVDNDYSERVIVCEGACNPELHDYDAAIERLAATRYGSARGGRDMRIALDSIKTLTQGLELKHTAHVPTSGTNVFKNGNWCKQWACTVCGHRRYF